MRIATGWVAESKMNSARGKSLIAKL